MNEEKIKKIAKSITNEYKKAFVMPIVTVDGMEEVEIHSIKIFINTTGNSALAKAGSGDVLTGMISGFLSQGLKPLNAAILGVFLHGLAGDIASVDYTVLASDVIDYIPFAIQEIIENE